MAEGEHSSKRRKTSDSASASASLGSNDCSRFFMDGKFYVIGGISNHHLPVSLTCGEEFDLETSTWRKIEGMYPTMNPTVEVPPSFAVVNDELFTLEYESYIIKKYDKTTNKWETIGRLPPPMVDSSNDWRTEIEACGDQLLVFSKEAGDDNGDGIVVNSWCPKSEVKDGNLDLKLVGSKDDFGCCVYNFTVMRC